MIQRKITLNPYQQTSYWWIKTIRAKVIELYLHKSRVGSLKDPDEEEFLNIFEKLDETDWRNIYLSLEEYIKDDVYSYVPTGDVLNPDNFNQETDKGKHPRLNEELRNIINQRIPDIRLADRGFKESVIYTGHDKSYEWYRSSGTEELPSTYDCSYNYVLTGNKAELDFYNLVLATCISVHEKRRDFNSTEILRRVFCEEYKKSFNLPNDISEIYDEFNKVFIAFEDRIDISRFWEEEFRYWHPKEIDKNGLDSYMELANKIALLILKEFDYQPKGDSDAKSLGKIR